MPLLETFARDKCEIKMR